MTTKEARELVESREKLDPNYEEAVELCIENDSAKAKPDPKVEVKAKPKAKAEVK